MTGASGGVAYFSDIYDTRLHHPARIETNNIGREFVEYLKGRYDFSAPGNFPSACPIFNRLGDAETSKRDFMARARQANNQIVETGWKWVATEDMVKASIPAARVL
jgi:hypothetical protein